MKLTRRGFNGMIGTAILAETWKAAWPALTNSVTVAAQATTAETDRLTSLSLTEVSEMIHSRTVTSTQLVKALLDRKRARRVAVSPLAQDTLGQSAIGLAALEIAKAIALTRTGLTPTSRSAS